MTLRELATCPAVTCTPAASIGEAARLMATAGIGFLVVVDGERPVGVLTDRDIVVRAVAADRNSDAPVADVMTSYAAHIDEDATVEQAARMMADKHCRRLPVTENGRIVGVLSIDDLLRVAGDELEQVARAVRGPRSERLSLP